MKKEKLDELKKLHKDIEIKNNKYLKNVELLNNLKNNKLVSTALKIIEENNDILKDVNLYRRNIDCLFKDCNHNLLMFKDYSYQMYDSYYTYQCIECGEIIESSYKMKKVIDCDISFNRLQNDYYNYLFKYDENISIDIMINKYNQNKNLYNDLVSNGISEIDAIKLVKKCKKGDI